MKNQLRRVFRVFTAGPAAFAGLMIAVMVCPGAARTADNTLGSLYGNQNLQGVFARYAPVLMSETGGMYELIFDFNSSSRKTENVKHGKNFFGVALGGGGFNLTDADLGDYGTRDAAAGYGLIQLEGKFLLESEGPVRPYLGYSFGLGNGSIWLSKPAPPDAEKFDNPSLKLFMGGVSAGTMLQLKGAYFLDLGLGIDARWIQFGKESEVLYPAMATIGITKWRGPMP